MVRVQDPAKYIGLLDDKELDFDVQQNQKRKSNHLQFVSHIPVESDAKMCTRPMQFKTTEPNRMCFPTV